MSHNTTNSAAAHHTPTTPPSDDDDSDYNNDNTTTNNNPNNATNSPLPLSQGLSRIINEPENYDQSTFVYYTAPEEEENTRNRKRTNSRFFSMNSGSDAPSGGSFWRNPFRRKKKRKLHQSVLPGNDDLSDRVITPIVTTLMFTMIIMDAFFFLFINPIPLFFESQRKLHDCLYSFVGTSFQNISNLMYRLCLMYVKYFPFFALQALNSYPTEKIRRRKRTSWCTRIMFVVLILVVVVMIVGEVYRIGWGSACLTRWNQEYGDDDPGKELSFDGILEAWNGTVSALIGVFLPDSHVAPLSSHSLQTQQTRMPLVSLNTSSPAPITQQGNRLTGLLDPVYYPLVGHNITVIYPAHPRTIINFYYPLTMAWIVFHYAVVSVFLICTIFILVSLLLQLCCGINWTYERFRHNKHTNYTQRLFEHPASSFEKAAMNANELGSSYQRFIDEEDDRAPESSNATPITDIELEDMDESEGREGSFSLRAFSRVQSSTAESGGIKSWLRGLFSDVKEFKYAGKTFTQTKAILTGHKVYPLDVLPPQRMIMAFSAGILVVVLVLVGCHYGGNMIFSIVLDTMLILYTPICSRNHPDNQSIGCRSLFNIIRFLTGIMQISLIFAIVATIITFLLLSCFSLRSYRKNMIKHRRGLQSLSSTRRFDGSITHGGEYAPLQAFHMAFGSLLHYIFYVCICFFGIVLGTLTLLLFATFARTASLEAQDSFAKAAGRLLSSTIVPVILSVIVLTIAKNLLKFNIQNNTRFKNMHVQVYFAFCASIIAAVVAPIKTLLKSLVLKALKIIFFFQRIDYRSSYAYTKYSAFFLTEAFYGNPVVNVFLDSIYQQCVKHEQEMENCFDFEARRKLRHRNRHRVTRFVMGALLAKNRTLRAHRQKEAMHIRSRGEIVKSRLKQLKNVNTRKSTYTPPLMTEDAQ